MTALHYCLFSQVDVALLEADTGGLDLAPANRLLPRPARSMHLATHPHTRLTATATLLTVPLASLLPASCSSGSSSDWPAAVTELPIITAGRADALAWWLEQELVPSSHSGSPAELLLSADPCGCSPQDAQLLPHIWQQLQYLDRHQLAPSQAVQVRCALGCAATDSAAAPAGVPAGAAAAAAGEAFKSLSLEGGSSSVSTAGSPEGTSLDVRLDVLLAGGGSGGATADSVLLPVSAEQAALSGAVPRYHTSMLNDSVRTAAYRDGIATALQAAERVALSSKGSGNGGDAPLVLEIGSGSGLLCLLACRAGARTVVGCERLPELQAAAAQLLAANGVSDRVTILPKHSRDLTVASEGNGAPASQPADLPHRAAMLMHEIFGTDPFSEGVCNGSSTQAVILVLRVLRRSQQPRAWKKQDYAGPQLSVCWQNTSRLHCSCAVLTLHPAAGIIPSLLHAREHLLAPGAVLAPCSVRVIAAVAASPTQHRLLRPPSTVCGGAVTTRALRQLAPRKMDCQAGEAGELHLLTAPAAVLEVDLASSDLQLADSCTTLLECLPCPLPLRSWMAEQQKVSEGSCSQGPSAAEGSSAVALADSTEIGTGATDSLKPCLEGSSLYAVSWFEYGFPGGATGSTAPHLQRTEHWQQVVQPLEGKGAEAVLGALRLGGGGGVAGDAREQGGMAGIGGVLLTAGYRVDRLWFELAGLAALADGIEEEGEPAGELER